MAGLETQAFRAFVPGDLTLPWMLRMERQLKD